MLEALFSRDAKAELSTIIALHHGLGLKAEPLRAEDARELEPALSEEMEAAVLRPDEASIDNRDRKSTRLNSSHSQISYAGFGLKKKRSPGGGRGRACAATVHRGRRTPRPRTPGERVLRRHAGRRGQRPRGDRGGRWPAWCRGAA